jgi:hypothetical protein
MKFPPDIRVYGDQKFRGSCPTEALEQATFFNRVRKVFPDTWGILAIHNKNEGQRTHMQAAFDKSQGMVSGASDIVIPGRRTFVCEMKRRDHTQSHWQPGQIEYLMAAQNAGACSCIALGVDAAWEAFIDWSRLEA